MPDESHHTTTTSPTSQGSAPSAPARTTSRFHKPSVALSWILGIVFFLDIPPVLFWGWCAFVSSENNAPDNPPDCAPISPCSPTPIQRHRDITISQLLTGIVGPMRRSPVMAFAACLERDKTPLARACTIAPCVAVFLAIWFALPICSPSGPKITSPLPTTFASPSSRRSGPPTSSRRPAAEILKCTAQYRTLLA